MVVDQRLGSQWLWINVPGWLWSYSVVYWCLVMVVVSQWLMVSIERERERERERGQKTDFHNEN